MESYVGHFFYLLQNYSELKIVKPCLTASATPDFYLYNYDTSDNENDYNSDANA